MVEIEYRSCGHARWPGTVLLFYTDGSNATFFSLSLKKD